MDKSLQTLKSLMDEYINYSMAIAGAVVLGGIVFVINFPHGIILASVAASKQAVYTFFAGGLIARNGENLALRWDSRWLSLLVSIVVSTVIAVGLTFLVHSLRGTPEPLQSTIPTIILSPIGFFIIAWRRQQQSLAE